MVHYRPPGHPHPTAASGRYGGSTAASGRYGGSRRDEPRVPPASRQPADGPGGARSRKKRRGGRLRVLAVVVPLLAIAGAGTLIYLGGNADAPSGAGSMDAAGAIAGTPTVPAEATAPHVGSSDARFVKQGECLGNEGGPSKPKLVVVPCAPKTYEVLARFDGATDGEADAKLKCGTVPDYTNWYYFKSELDVLDYVLCLKLR